MKPSFFQKIILFAVSFIITVPFLSSLSVAQLFNHNSDSTHILDQSFFKNIKPHSAGQKAEHLKKGILDGSLKSNQNIENKNDKFTNESNPEKKYNPISKKRMTSILLINHFKNYTPLIQLI